MVTFLKFVANLLVFGEFFNFLKLIFNAKFILGCSLPTLTLENWGEGEKKRKKKSVRNLKPSSGFRNWQKGLHAKD